MRSSESRQLIDSFFLNSRILFCTLSKFWKLKMHFQVDVSPFSFLFLLQKSFMTWSQENLLCQTLLFKTHWWHLTVGYHSLLGQTANVSLYHVTKCSITKSFTVYYKFNYTEIGRFTPILSITIVLSCFYPLISQFENFSTWISRLPFAVNTMLIFSL